MELLNIWCSGGLQYIPIAIGLFGLVLLILAFKQSKSGSVTGGNMNTPRVESKQNMKLTSLWSFWWALILMAIAIACWIGISNSYSNVNC